MADNTTGIIFTQSGVPVRGSADYQHVYDSRWKYMEIEYERSFETVVPGRPFILGSSLTERTNVFRHGLGFVPYFETDFFDRYNSTTNPAPIEMYADKEYVFVNRRNQGGADGAIRTITGNLRVYNIPVLEDYTAPSTLPQGLSSPRSDHGVKFLDRNTRGVDIGDNSPIGFSVDSTKKMLAIHKHGMFTVNEYVSWARATSTSIDTTNNIINFTIASWTNTLDISWTTRVGTALTLSVGNVMPGGLQQQTTYYVIPVSSTAMKVATSYENALYGIAVDITSAGDGSMIIAPAVPSQRQDEIQHDVGYPPTFLLSLVSTDDPYIKPTSELYVGPGSSSGVGILMAADSKYLRFAGVQSVPSDTLAYIILKDPAELAR